jgi:hypothetical protein
MGLFESAGKVIGTMKGASDARERGREAKRDYWARLDAMNLEPYQVSEQAPAYEQTKSPVARAYLESFLTGSNADAVQGTRLGGTEARQATQNNFNQAYGGWDKLQKQQNADLSNNERFQPKPIDFEADPVRDEKKETHIRSPYVSQIEKKIGRPLTPEEAMIVAGGVFAEDNGTFRANTRPGASPFSNHQAMFSSASDIENWLKNYPR